jgi:hypothetical protein
MYDEFISSFFNLVNVVVLAKVAFGFAFSRFSAEKWENQQKSCQTLRFFTDSSRRHFSCPACFVLKSWFFKTQRESWFFKTQRSGDARPSKVNTNTALRGCLGLLHFTNFSFVSQINR